MPDIKDTAPILAAAQLDPASVKARLEPKPAPKEVQAPTLTPTQADNILTWYAAGEKDPKHLARMAVADLGLVTDLVGELDALKAEIAKAPDEPLVNTLKPVEAELSRIEEMKLMDDLHDGTPTGGTEKTP